MVQFLLGMLTQKRLTRNQRVKEHDRPFLQLIAGYFQMVAANLDVSVTAGHKMAALAVVFSSSDSDSLFTRFYNKESQSRKR